MAAADQSRSCMRVQASGLPTPHARNRAFWIGLVVMVLSLISGLATYLILTNLTPIVPTGEVVLAGRARQRHDDPGHARRDRLADVGDVAGLAQQGRRQPAAYPDRRAVQRDRRAAGDPAGDCRDDQFRPRPRCLVLEPAAADHPEFGAGRECLSAGARPDDPQRYRQHGQGPRRTRRFRCAPTPGGCRRS